MTEQKHHLVLGSITDYLTGQTIEDSHDERYRQNLARFLVEKKGYLKNDIEPRRELVFSAGDKKAMLKVDLCVTLRGKVVMILKYGPGSLVTRRRPGLAFSRLLECYRIPVVVVTNGRDAEILDGTSGEVTGEGLGMIPSKTELESRFETFDFSPVSSKRIDMESRILFAYEVDGSCPCDDNICRLQ